MAGLKNFSVDDLVQFSADLRHLGEGTDAMEVVAQRLCDYLYGNLVAEDGGPGTAVVRLYKTHGHHRLRGDLAVIARRVDDTIEERTPCLVLLASAPGGREATVRDDTELVRPLTPRAIAETPLMVRMMEALGVDIETVLDPSKVLAMRLQSKNLSVYVESGLGDSEWIPDLAARERVRELGIKDMIGLGGLLPSGDLFLLCLFTREPVDERVADLFSSLVIAVKAALIPHTFRPFA